MDIIEKIDKYLNEAKIDPKVKKELQGYAEEIAKRVKKQYPEASEDQLKKTVLKVMLYMSEDKSNANYKQFVKFMPTDYNKELFDNGSKNKFDSVWWSMNDSQHDTIVRKAVKGII